MTIIDNDSKAELIESFRRSLVTAQKQCTEWAEQRFSKNPSDALEWSNDTFSNAARVSVLAYLLLQHEENPELSLKTLHGIASREVGRRSRYGSFRSTSMPSNLMEERRLMAWSEVLEHIEQTIMWAKHEAARKAVNEGPWLSGKDAGGKYEHAAVSMPDGQRGSVKVQRYTDDTKRPKHRWHAMACGLILSDHLEIGAAKNAAINAVSKLHLDAMEA